MQTQDNTTTPAVFGASEMVDRDGPWKGYPREALFAEARAIRAAEGISLTRALCRVVIAYEQARQEAERLAALRANDEANYSAFMRGAA